MPVRELSVPSTLVCDSQYDQDMVNFTHVFRCLGFNIRFGVVSETKIPVISSAPSEVSEASSFGCLFTDFQRKDLQTAYFLYSTVRARLLSFKKVPARADEFNAAQFLACETIAHATRGKACLEKDVERREELLSTAYGIYEGVILATCHSALVGMIKNIDRSSPKSILFQPIPDMGKMNPDWRRMISHSFAGMAICVMLGREGNQKKFISLVSASVCCEARRQLELASVLRFLAFLMCWSGFVVPTGPVPEAQVIDAVAQIYSMYTAVTESVILPCMLSTGRTDLFSTELGFIEPGRRAEAQRFAESVHQHTINRRDAPAPFTFVRTHIVDGKILDRKCAACGVWDRSGRSHARCARCMMVYYCCKECQTAHWKEHKAVCGEK